MMGQRVPRRGREQLMVDRRIVGSILPADPERDDVLDFVGDLVEPRGEIGRSVQGEIGADRGVSARDVEADADHRHLVPVRGHTANRHDVAKVAVRHQRRTFGAAGHVVEFRQRLGFVLAKNVNRAHSLCPILVDHRGMDTPAYALDARDARDGWAGTVSRSVPWFLYAVIFASTSVIVGVTWDISWHRTIGRDTFWTPAHLAIYLGGIVAGLTCGWIALRLTFGSGEAVLAERAATVRFW